MPGLTGAHERRHQTGRAALPATQRATRTAPGAAPARSLGISPSLQRTLLANANLRGRGNGPVLAAVFQEMQQTHGNRYVQRLHGQLAGLPPPLPAAPVALPVQRLTAEEKQENLVSPKYAGNTRLEQAFDNAPPLTVGAPRSSAVRLVQEGLVDDGFVMPKSTKPTGELDGSFGQETVETVKQFQGKHAAECGTADGSVGHKTMGALDRLALGKNPPAAPPPGLAIDLKSFKTDPHQIFFLRGSAEIPDIDERSKILLEATPAKRALTLKGRVSEDEDPSLAQARIDAVAAELKADHHDNVLIKDAQPSAARGLSDYRNQRFVEMVPAGQAPTSVDCTKLPAQQRCDARAETTFQKARAQAGTAIGDAIATIDPANPNTTLLLQKFFKDTSPATAATVKANLAGIAAELSHFGEASAHECATACDDGCRTPGAAENGEVGKAGKVTLCLNFFAESGDERTRALVHEAAHGTAGLGGDAKTGAKDLSTGNQRPFEFLSTVDALRNADTYALFVMESNGVVLPKSQPPQDTAAGLLIPEVKTARESIARTQIRLLDGRHELLFLYSTINESKPPAKAWSSQHAENLMRVTAPLFNLTAPPALPTSVDQVAVAGIIDRIAHMASPTFKSLDLHKNTKNKTAWEPGPEQRVDLGTDFFALGPTVTDAHVDVLVGSLAAATPEILPDHQPKFVVLSDAVNKQP
jgi:hypothetical protein